MIILDTNVLSALMLKESDPSVVTWLDGQAPESIWTTSITVFEIRYELELMAAGGKQQRLTEAFDAVVQEDLADRILQFDSAAATQAALVCAQLRTQGRSIEIRDGMICGIALSRRGTLATRNVRHFQATAVSIVNPWS